MQCDQVQLDLQGYLHGELPLHERAEIQRHLSECPACAEEAAAMKETGHRLHVGLHSWADQGICPPELMASIEASIRAIAGEEAAVRRRKPWYRTWPAMAGAVAAAAVMLVIIGGQLGMQEQIAALPLVGGIATHLMPGQLHEPGDYRLLTLKGGSSAEGIELSLLQLEANHDQTRIQYALKGRDLDTNADGSAYAPVLQGPNGPVPFRNLMIIRKADQVTINAFFDAVAPGALTFTIEKLPIKGGSTKTGPWQASFNS